MKLFFHIGGQTLRLRDADWKEDEHKRDEGGKFSTTGGGGAAEKRDYIGNHEHRQALADEVAKQYGLHPIRVEMNDLGGDYALGTAGGRTHVNLNSAFFTPEKLAKYAKEWDGALVGAHADDPQATARAVILHEIGHVAMRQIQGQSPQGTRRNKAVREYDERWQAIEDLADEYHKKQDEHWPVSVYAQEAANEFAAEAFAAQHLDEMTGAGPEDKRAWALNHAKEFWEKLRAFGVPPKGTADAEWKEDEHKRDEGGRFSSMSASMSGGQQGGQTETRASEAATTEPIGRPPQGMPPKTHRALGDYGFRYVGKDDAIETNYSGDYEEGDYYRYEHPKSGDKIAVRLGPDEDAVRWHYENVDDKTKQSGYGENWEYALKNARIPMGKGEREKRDYAKTWERRQEEKAGQRKAKQREDYPAHFSVIKEMAEKYDYPLDKFEVLDPAGGGFVGTVNGRKFTVGGWAEPDSGRIVMNSTVSLEGYNKLLAHEIFHQKQFAAEREDPAIKEYWVDNFSQLREDDGLTSYSRDWWANLDTAFRENAGIAPAMSSAVAETLAEMALKKEGNPDIKFTSTWETLYEMIDTTYAGLRISEAAAKRAA